MAVTFARSAGTVNGGNVTAATPAGSGGVIVVAVFFRGNAPAANTPGDWSAPIVEATWNNASIAVLVSQVASPDMQINAPAGTYEFGCYSVRVDDATGTYVSATSDTVNQGTTTDLPDVGSAPDGVALAFSGIINDGHTYVSSSLGWTEHYSGDIGDSGWYARDCVVQSLDVTPGGGTFDPGTATWSASGIRHHVVLVLETGGAPAVPSGQLDSLASEVELGFAARSGRAGAVGLATEVELGFVGRSPVVDPPASGSLDTIASEVELAFEARSDRAGALGLDTRTALAFVGRTPAGGQLDSLASEVELGFAGRSDRAGAVGLATEVELGFAGRTVRSGGLDVVGETELGFVGRAAASGQLDLGTSTSLSFVGVAPGGGGRLGLDSEVELGFVGSTARAGQLDTLGAGTALGFVTRSDRAGALGLDTRTALAFVGRRPTLNTGFGLASRTALAFVGRTPRRGSLNLVSEIDFGVAGRTVRSGSLALLSEAELAFFSALLGTHPTAHSSTASTTVTVLAADDGTTVFAFWRGQSVRYVEHPGWVEWSGDPAQLATT